MYSHIIIIIILPVRIATGHRIHGFSGADIEECERVPDKNKRYEYNTARNIEKHI